MNSRPENFSGELRRNPFPPLPQWERRFEKEKNDQEIYAFDIWEAYGHRDNTPPPNAYKA
jgi:hypothetical protein